MTYEDAKLDLKAAHVDFDDVVRRISNTFDGKRGGYINMRAMYKDIESAIEELYYAHDVMCEFDQD